MGNLKLAAIKEGKKRPRPQSRPNLRSRPIVKQVTHEQLKGATQNV